MFLTVFFVCVLYFQLGGLEDLSGQISQLRVSHNKLSSALNTTRQQISLVDVQNLSEGK